MPRSRSKRAATPLLAALLFAALLAAFAAGPAAAATQIAAGNYPDAVTDRDGVTHVVWNESRSGSTDVLHYCQIPRGAPACTDSQTFTPPATDFDGPHVVLNEVTGQVILLTNRNFQNYVYVSGDDGAPGSFTGPTPIGTVGPGSAADPAPVLYDAAGQQIVTIAWPTGGIQLQGQPLGQMTTAKAQLSTYDSTSPSVVQLGPGSFVAAWQDISGNSYVRTFNHPETGPGAASVNVASNWTPQVEIPNAEYPRLASGPNGTFLMYRVTSGANQGQYLISRLDGTSVGAPVPLSDGTGGNFRDIVEDAGGLLHALFVDKNNGLGYRASADGTTWGDQQTLAPGPDFTIAHVRVTARTVDDGFTGLALWESAAGGVQNPPILMQALPDPSISLHVTPPPGASPAPPTPGTGTTPPPPPAACRLLTFAAVDVIADACLTRDGTTYTATGGLKINGLRIELGSGKLKLDTKARTITSSGATVTVKAGDTVLFKAPIDFTLPKGSTADLGTLDLPGAGDLLGFPLKGSIGLEFKGGGAVIPVHLGLPALFGGVTGDVTIRADNLAGVHLRELHVKVGDALIGPLEIKNLFFDYDADNVSWAGGATAILPPQPPGPSLAAKVGFSHGNLDYLSNELTLPGNGIPLDPFAVTYLKTIRFELKTNPLRLTGGVTINAGPTIAGVAAIGVDGDLTLTLADPTIIRADGRVSLVSIPLGNAYFELRTNGYVGFGGHVGYSLSGFSATADVSGWLFKSAFNVEAGANICLGDLGCLGGDVVVSSTGFAGCAHTFIADFGAGYKWGDSLDIMFHGCDIGPYRAVAAAAQAGAAPTSVTLGAGLPSAVVAVDGQGAPPHVSLVGPGGAPRIDAAAEGKTQTDSALAFHVPETDTTYFVVKHPPAGTWTVEPAADSVPIADVKSADGLDAPKVTAHVTRAAGGKRTLSYTTNSVPGQTVTFAEQGKLAAQTIGKATGRSGTLRFTPADGPGGTRKIIAMVSSYGQPRASLTVGSYVAPPPARPATPPHLRARRSGTKLVVTWGAARNAKRYEVTATVSDGRRLALRQKTTKLTIPAFATKAHATITVVGLKADNTRGRKATVKILAKKTKTTKKKR